MNAISSIFLGLAMISMLEGAQSMMRSSPEKKVIVPSRAALDKTSKKPPIDNAQRGRLAKRYGSPDVVVRPSVNSPSERLRRLQVPNREDSYERLLDRDFRRLSVGRTQKKQAPSRFRSPEPASFSRVSDRGNRRVPLSEPQLIDMRASLQPHPPDSPDEVKVQLRPGKVKTIARESEVDYVYHPGPNNRICFLDDKDVASICGTCVKVYEELYHKKKYRALDALPRSEESTTCQLRKAQFGITTVQMSVRRCPFSPKFYVSQGNGNGWVFVFSPLPGTENKIKFDVHLGEFNELMRLRRP